MPTKKKVPAKKATKAPAKPAAKPKAAPKPKAKAKAPAKKKPAAKPSPAAKPKAKAKAPAKSPEPVRDATIREAMAKPEANAQSVRGLVADLIAEQKHTDQEIIAAVQKAIPDKAINLNIIGACRSEMNHGTRIPSNVDRSEKHTPPAVPYEQVLKIDGVNMLRSERPPKVGKPRKPARGKVAPEHDPLSKLGIDPPKRKPARKETVAA